MWKFVAIQFKIGYSHVAHDFWLEIIFPGSSLHREIKLKSMWRKLLKWNFISFSPFIHVFFSLLLFLFVSFFFIDFFLNPHTFPSLKSFSFRFVDFHGYRRFNCTSNVHSSNFCLRAFIEYWFRIKYSVSHFHFASKPIYAAQYTI